MKKFTRKRNPKPGNTNYYSNNEKVTNNDYFKKVMNSLLLRLHTKLSICGRSNKKKKVKKFNMQLLRS